MAAPGIPAGRRMRCLDPRRQEFTVTPMKPAAFCRTALLGVLLAVSGCETMNTTARVDPGVAAAITNETPGNYFIGRRYYKKDYKMWGWVRSPGQQWKDAKLVMMNENTKLAPDRAAGTIGIDNNHEYRLQGRFTGGQVYEPASDRFYPEFVLTGYEVTSTAPPMIFGDRRALDPAVRLLTPPQ